MKKKPKQLLEIEKDLSKFHSKKETYSSFGEELEALIHNIITEEKIPFHEVIFRVKNEESIREKIISRRTSLKGIKDILGIRIITYIKPDAEKICKIIEKEFETNPSMTQDHSEKSKLGYRGTNYVAKLNDIRKNLPEYKIYQDIEFEIQITTILDHAWSEIQHERSYKLPKLPKKFKEDFKALAASLAIIDNQFTSTCNEVDETIKEIGKKTEEGKIKDISLDSVSLKGYLNERFKENLGSPINPVFGKKDIYSMYVLNDLKFMNINNLEALEKIIPSWIKEHLKFQEVGIYDYSLLIMDILLIKFKEEYIKKSEILKIFQEISLKPNEEAFLKTKGIDYLTLCRNHGYRARIDS